VRTGKPLSSIDKTQSTSICSSIAVSLWFTDRYSCREGRPLSRVRNVDSATSYEFAEPRILVERPVLYELTAKAIRPSLEADLIPVCGNIAG
jgi:hypothetical protein